MIQSPLQNQSNPRAQTPSISIVSIAIRSGALLGILLIALLVTVVLCSGPKHLTPRMRLQRVGYPSRPANEPNAEPNAEPIDETGIQECIVTLISGRKISGELIHQDSTEVIVGINGIETTFQRPNVGSVLILPPVSQRYHQLRDAIPKDDIEARLTLVEWLRARKAYPLALEELDSILIDDPTNPHAKVLHTWLTAYEHLGPGKATDPQSTTQAPEKTPNHRRMRRNEARALTPEQINLMRVYEIDLRDPPKLKVPDDTLRTLMRSNPNAFSPNEDERNQIFELPEVEKLKILFTHKARDLYTQVKVLEDPTSIKIFKQKVQSQNGWIINTCASTRCHGGTHAGTFELINTRANSDATAYTNLYTIEHYTLPSGSKLINFQDPERSPLLQMAMVKKNALTPHPPIPRGYPGPGFRAIFRSTRDRKFRDAIDWIRSMYQPRPEYGFESQIQPEPKPNPSTPVTTPRPTPGKDQTSDPTPP